MKDLGKLITAIVTPFDNDLNVDYKKLQELSEKLLKSGSDGFVVFGTTGESPTLSKTEKLKIISATKEVISNKGSVIAGTGSNNTIETISFSKEAEKNGADALLLVNPYYNKPNQDGLFTHFKMTAESVSLPIVLYNHPGRTGVCLELETLLKLSEIENIVAIKESSGNLELISQFIKNTPDDFRIYSGDDSLNFSMFCLGAYGAVSVASHLIGNQIKSMIDFIEKNDLNNAREIHHEFSDLLKVLFCAPSPAPLKFALSKIGFNVGDVRLPLLKINKKQEEEVTEVLNKLNIRIN